MSLSLYATTSIGDVRRALLSSIVAVLVTYVANGSHNREHAQGALDLARSQAVLYGLDWKEMLQAVRHMLDDGPTVALLDEAIKRGGIECQAKE